MNSIQKIGTAAAATTIVFTGVVAPQQAQAGCWPALAASTLNDMTRAGAPIGLAVDTAVADGNYEKTTACYYKTVGVMKRFPYVYGWFLNNFIK